MSHKSTSGEPARPVLVSQQAWATVPHEDRADVLPLAGMMAVRGFEPDDAIAMGLSLLRHRRILAHPHGRRVLRGLSAAFDERYGDAVPRSPQMTSACEALLLMLDEETVPTDPARLAATTGAWTTGAYCAACGNLVAHADRAAGRLSVHMECTPQIKQVAGDFRTVFDTLKSSATPRTLES